eukprot:Rmarinus@m.29918
MSGIQNLESRDLFAEAEGLAPGKSKKQNLCHIRIQQRNRKKCLTTVDGIPKDIDHKKVLKAFKQMFSCNGNIVKAGGGEDGSGEESGSDEDAKSAKKRKIIQLQGDHRSDVAKFLAEEEIIPKENIRIHGF